MATCIIIKGAAAVLRLKTTTTTRTLKKKHFMEWPFRVYLPLK